MRFLIHVPHGAMSVDNAVYPINVAGLPPNVAMVQFDFGAGVGGIQYNDRPMVWQPIAEPSAYQSFVNLWLAAGAAAVPPITLAQAIALKQAMIPPIYAVKKNALTTSYMPVLLAFGTTSTAPGNGGNWSSTGDLIAFNDGLNHWTITGNVPCSGKVYFEIVDQADSGGNAGEVGIILAGDSVQNSLGNTAHAYAYRNSGQKVHNNNAVSYGTGWPGGAVVNTIGVAFDVAGGNIWFSLNGVWQGGATATEIANGVTTHAAYTGIPAGSYYPAFSSNDNNHWTANFGNTAFAHAPPTGYGPTFPLYLWSANDPTYEAALSALAVGGAVSFPPPLAGSPALTLNMQSSIAQSMEIARQNLVAVANTISANVAALPSIGAVIAFDVSQGWPTTMWTAGARFFGSGALTASLQ